MKVAYIVDAVRTPIGKHGGSLSTVRADDLLSHVLKKLTERQPELDLTQIEDVIIGCANQAGEDNRNVARMALLLAEFPMTVPGQTLNRLCASGLSAVNAAAHAISSGEGEIFIAGGVESMTRAPYVLSKGDTPFSRTQEMFDTSLGWRFVNPRMREMYGTDSMGETAEHVSEKYRINRADQDKFALSSQKKASAARSRGRFKQEIVAVSLQSKKGVTVFEEDEFIRPDTTLETLGALRPAFKKDGTVTAGNSSGINDGACALLIASDEALKNFSLKPRAQIIGSAQAGVEPKTMGIGPVPAVRKVLSRYGLSLEEMDVIELNEAFASQSLACLRELGLADDDPRVNINGGAIALGHPLGMSGARLISTAMYELIEKKGRYALCTMCVGVGQGVATIIERV